MQLHVVVFIGLVVLSPLSILHAGPYVAKPELDPTTEKVIQDSLRQLQDQYGVRGFGFKNAPQEISNLRGLGFDSVDQLTKVIIGQGFPLYVVQLNKLRGYVKGTDPWPLFVKTTASIYPLLILQGANLEVRSSATVSFQQRREGKTTPWVAGIGNPPLIRLLTEARIELQREGHCFLPSDCFAVSIPALSLHLFGYRDERAGEFKIVTLNRVRGHVKQVDFRAAKDAIEELSNDSNNQQYNNPTYPHKLNPKKELGYRQ